MAYTPPTGNSIVFTFAGAYTPPAGNVLALEFAETAGGEQYCSPYGWDSSVDQYGTITIAYDGVFHFITPATYLATEYGALKVRLDQFVRPVGELETEYGTPQDADHEHRTRRFNGFDATQFGSFKVYTRQYLYPAPGASLTEYGLPFIDFGLRYINFADRGIEPLAFSRHEIDYEQIKPYGLDATEFAVPRVRNTDQFIYPYDIPAPDVSFPRIALYARYLYPPSIPCPPGDFDAPVTEYGPDTRIKGPPPTVFVQGVYPPQIPLPTIVNAARAVAFEGKGFETAEYSSFRVEYVNRTVSMPGTDMFAGPFLVFIRNAAKAVNMVGIPPLPIPTTHDIRDSRKDVKFTYTVPMTEYGQPFISFSPRTLTVFMPPGPELIPVPSIALGTHYADPVGIEPLYVPKFLVEHHQYILAPVEFDPPPDIPRPTIANVNRALKPAPALPTEFGLPRLHKTTLEAVSFDVLIFGTTRIRDQATYLTFTMGDVFEWGKPGVRHDPPVPDTQYVTMIGFDALQPIENPVLDYTGVHVSSFNSMVFSEDIHIDLVDRELKPKGWFGDGDYNDLFGIPHFTYDQFAKPSSIPLDLTNQVPEPRVSPHTVVAPKPGQPVDFGLEKIGKPTIEYFHRPLAPYGLDATQFGSHRVVKYIQYIPFKSFTQMRFGTFQVLGGDRTYEMGYIGTATQIPLTHEVKHVKPYSPFIFPPSFDSDEIGPETRIDLLNREVMPETDSDEHTRYGEPAILFDPRHVNLRETGTLTEFGPETFISFLHRTVTPVGFDSFNTDSTYPGNGNASRYPKGITPVHALR